MPATNFRDQRTYVVHLLRVLQKRGAVAPAEIYDEVADRAGVTPAEREVEAAGSYNPVYKNRIQFARQSLVDAGAVIGSSEPGWQRGHWQLTPEGRVLAETKSDHELDNLIRARVGEGARARAEARKQSRALAGLDDEDPTSAAQDVSEREDSDDDDPTPQIANLVDTANETAMAAMLDHVRGIDDTAFEELVGTVLKAALRADSVRITQRSRDGGIDGVLHFDALGIRFAVFEAKRYAEGNVVGRPLIDAFATAARRHRATHALFVTSSHFSTEAIDAARDEAIRLIDGVALVELMAQHEIGLRARKKFVVFEVDPTWGLDADG